MEQLKVDNIMKQMLIRVSMSRSPDKNVKKFSIA